MQSGKSYYAKMCGAVSTIWRHEQIYQYQGQVVASQIYQYQGQVVASQSHPISALSRPPGELVSQTLDTRTTPWHVDAAAPAYIVRR